MREGRCAFVCVTKLFGGWGLGLGFERKMDGLDACNCYIEGHFWLMFRDMALMVMSRAVSLRDCGDCSSIEDDDFLSQGRSCIHQALGHRR